VLNIKNIGAYNPNMDVLKKEAQGASNDSLQIMRSKKG
jgi:hypothetical protein